MWTWFLCDSGIRLSEQWFGTRTEYNPPVTFQTSFCSNFCEKFVFESNFNLDYHLIQCHSRHSLIELVQSYLESGPQSHTYQEIVLCIHILTQQLDFQLWAPARLGLVFHRNPMGSIPIVLSDAIWKWQKSFILWVVSPVDSQCMQNANALSSLSHIFETYTSNTIFRRGVQWDMTSLKWPPECFTPLNTQNE